MHKSSLELPTGVKRSPNLSPWAKLTYAEITCHRTSKTLAKADVEEIADNLGTTPERIQSALSELHLFNAIKLREGCGWTGELKLKLNSKILSGTKESFNQKVAKIVEYLNDICDRSYRTSTRKTRKKIHARLEEGFKVSDFEKVIKHKYIDWKGTKWEKYLRPSTLFNSKFESYLQNAKHASRTEKERTDELPDIEGKIDIGEEWA